MVETEKVEEEIIEIIKDCMMEDEMQIKDDDHLVHDIGLDSIAFVDLSVQIENKYNIHISDLEMMEIQTFGQLLLSVLKKRNR